MTRVRISVQYGLRRTGHRTARLLHLRMLCFLPSSNTLQPSSLRSISLRKTFLTYEISYAIEHAEPKGLDRHDYLLQPALAASQPRDIIEAIQGESRLPMIINKQTDDAQIDQRSRIPLFPV